MSLPKGVSDIIIYYLNLHELYLEELKEATNMIHKIYTTNKKYYIWPFCIVCIDNKKWKIGTPFVWDNKEKNIKILKKIHNKRGKLYELKNNRAWNKCYINY